MAAKFGTSGLRGLNEELTDGTAARHASAFAAHLLASGAASPGSPIYIGQDFRGSSPEIARQCREALAARGLAPVDCGALPTPALALHAMSNGAASLMVTGSHIPADRNGVKFYRPDGEIDKADEAAIARLSLEPSSLLRSGGNRDAASEGQAAIDGFEARYAGFLKAGALTGRRIGIYEHSTVARDVLRRVLASSGAELVSLGRSEGFVPVDTEAVPTEIREQIRQWTRLHRLDALISADGDGDRPLVADETGECVRGDALGLVVALHLEADLVVTPITSNSGIERAFAGAVKRTRVGSPFVIEAMNAGEIAGARRIIGFEANGGTLVQSAFETGRARLAPLPTRDSVLPILSLLARLGAGQAVSELLAGLALPIAVSGLIREFPTERGQLLVATLTEDASRREAFFAPFGGVATLDFTDGLRATLRGGDILHLRPSGNAPEMRCYVEAATEEAAAKLANDGMARVSAWTG